MLHQWESVFIKGRNILEGISILLEVLHSAHRNRDAVFILKLDFEKAYDRVSWEVHEGVVFEKGFDPLWVSSVM